MSSGLVRNAMMLKNKNKKNRFTGTCAQTKCLSSICKKKNIALPVWTIKSECYKVLFAVIEVNNPNWSDFSKYNAKNFSDQN